MHQTQPCNLSDNDYHLIHTSYLDERHELTILSTHFLDFPGKKETASMILRGLASDDLVTLRDWLNGIITHQEKIQKASQYNLP